ncbi:MAG: hypothetical protein JW849_09020 [Phycisphaerae bacterium]|nr:hypothetical protein [Phycisphaerae bacterium]
MAVGVTEQEERFVTGESVQRYKIKRFDWLHRIGINKAAGYDNRFSKPLQNIPRNIRHATPTETPTLGPPPPGGGSMKRRKKVFP